MNDNIEHSTVAGFGDEWRRFSQDKADREELQRLFERYFALFPWGELPENSTGIDLGCGTGRWGQFVAPYVGRLYCVEASKESLEVAKNNLSEFNNCIFLNESVGSLSLKENSLDFGYSLGVLHHVPDTSEAIKSLTRLLKPEAPLLLYLYYAFDNKPAWYRALWKASEVGRYGISRMPYLPRYLLSQLIAASVYWPLARTALLLEKGGKRVENLPLADYRRSTFYRMRHNALDRFGTRLEKRFSAFHIRAMMESAGLRDITFRQGPPYWCAIGYKSPQSY